VFVARLVVNGATANFVIANNGQPIGTGDRADITFSGNTPYVTWRSQVAGNQVAFTGHFVNAASPTFVLDSSNVPLTPTAQADVREPISSSCIATPFNADGAACQGGAIGTPFFLYTNGTAPTALFAQAYDVDTPTTGLATGLSTTTATLTGTVNPEGGPARVSFQFGTTTAYGQTTAASAIAPTNTAVSFQAPLTGLPPSTTLHYRAVATTDFGVKLGPDQTLTTGSVPPPPPNDTTPPAIKLKIARITLGKLIKSGKIKITTSLSEAGSVRASATIKVKVKRKRIAVGISKVVTTTFTTGGSKTLSLPLTRNGKSILRQLRTATITVTIRAVDKAGNTSTKTVSSTVKRY
jgi:hypothetical protein